MAERNSRKRYTLDLKYEVCLKLEDGRSAASLMREYGISSSVISGWRKDREKICTTYEECKAGRKAKSLKKAKYPEIEEEVAQVVERLNVLGCAVSDDFIGRYVSQKAKEKDLDLKASKSYVYKLKKRNNIETTRGGLSRNATTSTIGRNSINNVSQRCHITDSINNVVNQQCDELP